MKGTAHRASTAHPAITFIGRLALAALILVVLVEVYFLARGFNLYREAIEEAGLDEMAASIQSSESFTPIDELPDLYLQAVVAVEDHRFYAHPGFDAIATARALVNDLKAGAIVEGGSTITQQLAKNQYFTQEQTVERKIAEVFMALTMEQHFSKRTILELYVNSIYFGDGYEGIGSASWGYFGKAPSALDADECTLLAGIPNAPSVYALSQNPGLARERQQEEPVGKAHEEPRDGQRVDDEGALEEVRHVEKGEVRGARKRKEGRDGKLRGRAEMGDADRAPDAVGGHQCRDERADEIDGDVHGNGIGLVVWWFGRLLRKA